MRENYYLYKNLYKYLASQYPLGEIWTIQWISFADFMNKLDLYNESF
jgi:hypothetical protein